MKLVPIFEAVIQPSNFDVYIQRLSDSDKIGSIAALESLFDGKVKFITLSEFKKLNPKATLPPHIRFVIQQQGGIGAGTVMNGQIYIMCDPTRLLKTLNTNNSFKSKLVQNIKMFLRHEDIHVQQIERSSGKLKDVDQAGTPEEMKNYLKNPQELMAYAQTIIDDLRNTGMSVDSILQSIKNGTWDSPLYLQYLHMFKDEPKVLNQLKKYIYQYLTQKDS